MKNLIITLIGCLIVAFQAKTQSCNVLFDDFSNGNLWTQVGNDVLVNNGIAEFKNDATDGEQRRIHRPINTTLNSNDSWKVEAEFHATSTPTGATGHSPISLTAGTKEPLCDCPNVACTAYPQGTQDGIAIAYLTTSPQGADRGFAIIAREGNNSTEFSSPKIDALHDSTYYVRLERTAPTMLTLSVFSDAAKTIHLQGSPVSLTIPNTIDGLNTLQVGNHARGWPTRKLNGWVDNVCISMELPDCNLLADDFSNGNAWTQIGTDVLVNNGQALFQNDAIDGEQRRIYRPIGTTLNSNDSWRAEADFHVTSTPTGATGHSPISLTAGTKEPFSDCQTVACTGYPNGTQDGVSIAYVTTSPNDTDRGFVIIAREGSNSTEFSSPKIDALAADSTYYLALERLSPTQLILGVFSDAGRTMHLPGSPVSLTIPSTIDGLNTVQVGNHARGWYTRTLNGWVDNICLSSETLLPVKNDTYINPEITIFPNPSDRNVTIQIDNPTNEQIAVYLVDGLGRQIWESGLIENRSSWNKALEIEDTGIFFVLFKIGDQTHTKRLIIIE